MKHVGLLVGLLLAAPVWAGDDPPNEPEPPSIDGCLLQHGSAEPGQEEGGVEGLKAFKQADVIRTALHLIASATDPALIVGAATYLGSEPVRATASPKDDRAAALRKRLQSKPSPQLRLALIEALGAMGEGSPGAIQAAPTLREVQAVARGLGRSSDPSAQQALLDALTTLREELSRDGEAPGGLALVDLEREPTPHLRQAVVLLTIKEVAESPRAKLLVAAVRALGAPTHLLPLLEWIRDEPGRLIVRSMGAELLGEEDPERRAVGAGLLRASRCLEEGDADQLTFLLGDKDARVRVAAIEAVTALGLRGQEMKLAALLEDPESVVQQAALKGLITSTQQSFPARRTVWERWLQAEASRQVPARDE